MENFPDNDIKLDNNIEKLTVLHRGMWADKLFDGQIIVVGGRGFGGEEPIKLKLDFKSFEKESADFTEDRMRLLFEKNKDALLEWLKETNSEVNPYAYFVCNHVQDEVHNLLEVKANDPISNEFDRSQMYKKDTPKLSELKGLAACAERAALGNWLMQKLNIKATYMSGVSMRDPNDLDEFPVDHSFLVLDNPTDQNSSLIFDIARPRSQRNLPRVLETDVVFNGKLFKGKKQLLVGSTEVLQGGRLWFGVGDPVAGPKKIVNKV